MHKRQACFFLCAIFYKIFYKIYKFFYETGFLSFMKGGGVEARQWFYERRNYKKVKSTLKIAYESLE